METMSPRETRNLKNEKKKGILEQMNQKRLMEQEQVRICGPQFIGEMN